MRILHVLQRLGRGGIQSWLIQVLRRIDRSHFQNDFLVFTDEPNPYDDEVRRLGCRIFRCPRYRQPWRLAATLKEILVGGIPYDIVHAHRHDTSGYVLKIAYKAGVPTRIAHSHNDTRADNRGTGMVRRLYAWQGRRWIRRYATVGLACSQDAAASLYGNSWFADGRWRLLNYGIDLTPFKVPVDRKAVREELQIPADAFVLGNVGRFFPQKNHRFLLEVTAECCRRHSNLRLLLIGDGPLRQNIMEQAARLGIADKIVMTGVRTDVPRLLRALDVFVFPSLFEGLGLALVEAQAAGLPCVFSDVVPKEADAIPRLLARRSLVQHSTHDWGDAIDEVCTRADLDVDALDMINQQGFSLNRSAELLMDTYLGQRAA
ncbi:MAG: glycosyltransferase [Burkholderiales bacterium]|nr:glycosyltransferase [Burkholderiales bacterium]